MSSAYSDTPLTDAALYPGRRECRDVVSAEFARTLERRLAAAEARVRELERALRDLLHDVEPDDSAPWADGQSVTRARAALADPPKGEQT